jgi:quinoprotein glucose dehydrogenase
MLRTTAAALVLCAAPAVAGDWAYYGADPGGSRYSALQLINRSNVADLRIAWVHRTLDHGAGIPSRGNRAFEATPILVDGRLYLSTPYNIVIALDPATGTGLWRYDPGLPKDRWYAENTSRGVAAWRDPSAPDGAPCRVRIFLGTLDGRLLALDAATGRPCAGFGEGGQVDLNAGTRPRDAGDYLVTSPPAVAEDLVIVGSAIGDNRAVDVELGIVRAFDARSGVLRWLFDTLPRDPADPAHAAWQPDDVQRTGAANAWAPLSVDVARDLVFIPTGSASPDYYGGERPGGNPYANSLVALRASSGRMVWHRQLVHHDLWDYDLPAQPSLVDVRRDGENIPAVVQVTKTGMVFVFHRETGEPLFPVEERPVPRSDVPGEQVSPTQPFSAIPPLVSHEPVEPDDAWGLTFWDRGRCRELISRYRSEGIFTPPGFEGTIVFPSFAGGSNWGGAAFDPEGQRLFVNVMHIAHVVTLIPRDAFLPMYKSGDFPDSEFARQAGTPFGMRRELLASPLGIPCTPPPWGTLAAVDLDKGRIAWQVPLGTTRDLAPWPLWYIRGVPNVGGPLVTAGGLLFIGAAADNYLRAFDTGTGEELWKGRLPAGGQATPMTYAVDGRQYVVIAAGGHGNAGTDLGDYVVAFTLPAR